MTTEERSIPPAEAHVVARIATGDDRALGELYDQHGAMAYGLALALMREPTEAEEVVADAFAQIWRTAASFDVARGGVAAWIATITRSRALDRLRARQRSARLLEEAAGASVDGLALPMSSPAAPDRDVEHAETRRLVRHSLDALPAPQRQAIELAYFSGLSQSEIAEHLREPLGTVKTRMRTGMEKLRQSLAPLMREEYQ